MDCAPKKKTFLVETVDNKTGKKKSKYLISFTFRTFRFNKKLERKKIFRLIKIWLNNF